MLPKALTKATAKSPQNTFKMALEVRLSYRIESLYFLVYIFCLLFFFSVQNITQGKKPQVHTSKIILMLISLHLAKKNAQTFFLAS